MALRNRWREHFDKEFPKSLERVSRKKMKEFIERELKWQRDDIRMQVAIQGMWKNYDNETDYWTERINLRSFLDSLEEKA